MEDLTESIYLDKDRNMWVFSFLNMDGSRTDIGVHAAEAYALRGFPVPIGGKLFEFNVNTNTWRRFDHS